MDRENEKHVLNIRVEWDRQSKVIGKSMSIQGGNHKGQKDPEKNNAIKRKKGDDSKITMFEELWYGTAKILTLGPSPLLVFEAQVPY